MSFQHCCLARGASGMAGMGVVLLSLMAASPAIAAPTTHTVIIEGMKFSPSTLEVKRGDAIVWLNKDLFPHDATEKNGVFRSGAIPAQDRWKFVATKRGQYSYECSLNPVMKATLVVK